MSVENPLARRFYETEALRGGSTVKQLDRQIDSIFYERTALSRDKAAMLTKHNRSKPEDQVTAEEEVKDPLVLEFLGVKDEYSETKIEDALILHLEAFLLELGATSHSLAASGGCVLAMRGIGSTCSSTIAGFAASSSST